MDMTWAKWMPSFLVYAGVISRSHLHLAASLFQYFDDIIYKGYTGFMGHARL